MVTLLQKVPPKKESNCFYHETVLGICLQNPLSYKKIISYYSNPQISFWRAFSRKGFFSNQSTISADFTQNADFSIKSQILKKIHHFKKSKSFLFYSKFGSFIYPLIRFDALNAYATSSTWPRFNIRGLCALI